LGTSSTPESDYDLKVDEQVTQFLESNHKLTYFLITAAVGTLGYTLSIAITKDAWGIRSTASIILLTGGAVAALLASGLALFALSQDSRSFRLHLRYRYERKQLASLSETELKKWDKLNHSARSCRSWSFWLLVATVALQTTFLLVLFIDHAELPMHHYGEDSTRVMASDSTFHVAFLNKESGREITMQIPRVGALEDPTATLDLPRAESVAREVAHVLRRALD
jgi:hypothetical protein